MASSYLFDMPEIYGDSTHVSQRAQSTSAKLETQS
jgi:hypothetical protein